MMLLFPRCLSFVVWLVIALSVTVMAYPMAQQPVSPLPSTSKAFISNPNSETCKLRNAYIATSETPTSSQTTVSDSSSDSDDEDEDTYEAVPDSRILPQMIDTSAITPRTASDSALAVFRNDPTFDYRTEVQQGVSWWELFKRWFWGWVNDLFSQKGFREAWGIAEKLLIAGAIIALVLFLSKTGVRSLFSRSVAVANDFDIVTENIHELDFSVLIDEAVRAGDFRRAVRLHYLRILKSLTDAGVITWSPEKTNRDYTREIRRNAGALAEEFIRLTLIFEQVRYGKYVVHLPEYSRLAPEFEAFLAVSRTIKLEQLT